MQSAEQSLKEAMQIPPPSTSNHAETMTTVYGYYFSLFAPLFSSYFFIFFNIKEEKSNKKLTICNRAPVPEGKYSLTAGPLGPVLLQDTVLQEKVENNNKKYKKRKRKREKKREKEKEIITHQDKLPMQFILIMIHNR